LRVNPATLQWKLLLDKVIQLDGGIARLSILCQPTQSISVWKDERAEYSAYLRATPSVYHKSERNIWVLLDVNERILNVVVILDDQVRGLRQLLDRKGWPVITSLCSGALLGTTTESASAGSGGEDGDEQGREPHRGG